MHRIYASSSLKLTTLCQTPKVVSYAFPKTLIKNKSKNNQHVSHLEDESTQCRHLSEFNYPKETKVKTT